MKWVYCLNLEHEGADRMEMKLEAKDGILIAFLDGELDHMAAERIRQPLEQRLEQGNFQRMILHMEKLRMMDSSGIGVILGRYKWLRQRDGKMVICHVRPVIRKVIELAGMHKIIPVVDRLDEALARIGGVK
jgi:stage II sporulation protein AA (anti-sigma F factor antagonist)